MGGNPKISVDHDREEIRKRFEELLAKELKTLREVFGEELLIDDGQWLTHKAWMDLGALDEQLQADALTSYQNHAKAISEENEAKRRLKLATANVCKTYETAIRTIIQISAKYNEKRQQVRERRADYEDDETARLAANDALNSEEPQNPKKINRKPDGTGIADGNAVGNSTAGGDDNDDNAGDNGGGDNEDRRQDNDNDNDGRRKETAGNVGRKFDPLDVASIMARAPVLRSQMGRQIIAETNMHNGLFAREANEAGLRYDEAHYRHPYPYNPIAQHKHHQQHQHQEPQGEPQAIAARVPPPIKVSLNGSLTEERDSTETEQDLEGVWPEAPNFDDDESYSFVASAATTTISTTSTTAATHHHHQPTNSYNAAAYRVHHHAQPVLQHRQDESWMRLPEPPVLRSKALQEFLNTHITTTASRKTINEFSLKEFEGLAENIQPQLTREMLNEAVRAINSALISSTTTTTTSITLMTIRRLLDKDFSTQQCEAVYRALIATKRI